MDDVTGIGDEKVLRQYNQWREVCRWDVEGDGPIEDEDDGLSKADWRGIAFEHEHLIDGLRALADSLIACYEELAGEHRLLQGCGDEIVEMLNKGQLVRAVIPDSPGPGWYWVRGHWRSRAQNSAAIDPDQGTVQAAPGEGQTGASGEATGHSPEGADPQIRDAYCRGRSGIPLGNWCNESQSGDATGADKEQPCPGCGSYRGTHGLGCRILALTQSGEERSE